MKHIYIISIILSSFFAISSLQAKENSLQYAFFIPQDAFQYNTYEQPQQKVKQETTTVKTDLDSLKKTIPQQNPDTKTDTKTDTTAATTVKTKNTETQKTVSKTTTQKPNKPLIAQKKTPAQTTNKKIAIGPFTININQDNSKNIKTTSRKEKSISDIFSEIPYPNNKLPKYKNAYLDYIMSLRVLHRTKKMQPDIKQEDTLAKANTLRRFDI